MEKFSIPRLIISGSSTGVGKTLLTMGIAYELRKRRLSTSCCVSGARLAQAAILKRVCGRYVRSIDDRLLTSAQTVLSLRHASLGADIILIDGKNGLYDGSSPGAFGGSDAELAALTSSPVVLVVDARGFGSSLAVLYKGYADSARGFKVEGALINHSAPEELKHQRDIEFFKESFEAYGFDSPLGLVPHGNVEGVVPLPGVSQAKNTTVLPRQFFVELERLVRNNVDVDRIIELANGARPVEIEDTVGPPATRRCRIAVSDDSCFCAGFQDNLDLLRYFGAELVPFSPLADEDLPKNIGGVYITGAYLSDYAEELAGNICIRNSLQEFANAGGVVFSEGAGTAWLCRDYRVDPQASLIPGVGLINATAVGGSSGAAYYEGVTIDESILGRAGLILKSINTGEWKISTDERLMVTMRVSRPGVPMTSEGYSPTAQLFATFHFFHFGSNPLVARSIIDAAQIASEQINKR